MTPNLIQVESKSKIHDEEKRKLVCQIELLRREIDAALLDRDRTIKEAHELREKLGIQSDVWILIKLLLNKIIDIIMK